MFFVYGESSGFPSIELSRKSFHSQVELCAEIPRISDEYKLLAMRRGRVSLVASMHDCGAAIQQGCNALCKCLEDFPEDFMNDNSIPLFETTEHIFTSVNTIYQLVSISCVAGRSAPASSFPNVRTPPWWRHRTSQSSRNRVLSRPEDRFI
jgi:hypothetical protein